MTGMAQVGDGGADGTASLTVMVRPLRMQTPYWRLTWPLMWAILKVRREAKT